MNRIITLLAVLMLGLPVHAAVAQPAFAQGQERCLAPREIQAAIGSGRLTQLSDALDRAGITGKIISSEAEVCELQGSLHWQVNVMDATGQTRPVSLPAE